jgi:hypothetical protein
VDINSICFVSNVEENVLGVFNAVLDLAEEQHSLTTINNSVVIGKGNVHDGASLNLVTNAHRAILDGVHAKDGALRRVDDRGTHHGTEDTTVGNSESAASHIFKTDLAVTSLN